MTEYLKECIRDTEPWRMKNRMLRHKALIQCARYAFGFSGIYDEEEGQVIANAVDITPQPPRPSQLQQQPPKQQAAGKTIDPGPDDIFPGDMPSQPTENHAPPQDQEQQTEGDQPDDNAVYFKDMEAALAKCTNEADFNDVWNEYDCMAKFDGDETSQTVCKAIKKRQMKRLWGDG